MKSLRINKTTSVEIFLASTILACFVLTLALTASAQPHPTMTQHVPAAVANGSARLVAALPADSRLSLAISLPLRNEDGLDSLLNDIYNPASPNFRHYLTVQQFTERFGPSESDFAALRQFAAANGLKVIDVPVNRMVLDVEGSAANIEKTFQVKMGVYQHPTENRTFYAPDREPALDLGISVLHISGMDNFTLPIAKHVRASKQSPVGKATGSGPGGDFVASDMRAAYYGSGPLTGSGQTVGLFEFAGYNVQDIQNYFNNLHQTLTVPINGVSLNGVPLKCVAPQCDDGEQSIDIEMAAGMAPGLDQVLVYVGSSDVSIFNQMAADNVAKQNSCSWGWTDNESSLDPIFKEMAAQGQTIMVATGDDGSRTPGDVVWPSDDPYVLAVGGTDIVTNGPGGSWKSETGWSGSAGMPSKNNIPIPKYQLLPGVINNSNGGSKTLRNIPDVAAESNTDQYSCYDNGCGGGNGGTSFAAPEWAALIALANQKEASHGKPSLGFLNTTLYNFGVSTKFTHIFHDITSGNNG